MCVFGGLPNGEQRFYEGEKGAEHLVSVKFPNGTEQSYEGERGAERLVSTLY